MGALMNAYGNLYANLAVSSALFMGTIGTGKQEQVAGLLFSLPPPNTCFLDYKKMPVL